jgi:hypothetical protein
MATYRYATKDLSIATAKAFLRSITYTGGDPAAAVYYVVLGNIFPYPNEPTPVLPEDNEQYLKYESHRRFIGGKKVTPADACHVTDRHNWVSGTVYSMYRDTDVDMYDRAFYVLTDEYNVYKCLYNNKNSASTVKPTGFSTIAFTTSDGYTWKYMYTISLGDANKFLTAAHMPVRKAEAGETSAESSRQLDVQDAAVNGSIEIVETVQVGSGYATVANGVVAQANSNSLTLLSTNDVSPINNYYVGSSVYISSGSGSGQLRRIIKYSGASKQLVVNTAFTTPANNDSRVVISPSVVIVGDGKGAEAYSSVDTSTGAISSINVIDTGSEYTRAKAYITANTDHGAGATANVVISPTGGHGSDAIRELFADKILLNVTFNGEEGVSANGNGYIPSNTEFRTVTVLRNPVLKVDSNNNIITTEVVANTSNSPSTLRFTTRAQISYLQMANNQPSNPLQVRETITNERMRLRAEQGQLEFVTELNPVQRKSKSLENAVRAANANIVYIREDETETDASFYTVYLNNVDSYGEYPAFVKDDEILVSDSETKIATVEAIKGPEANTFSGEVVFTENIQAVDRDLEQTEDIKIILDF